METINTYIQKHRNTIATYITVRPIFDACRQGEWRSGSMPRQWWWEQPMTLSNEDADGAKKLWHHNLGAQPAVQTHLLLKHGDEK